MQSWLNKYLNSNRNDFKKYWKSRNVSRQLNSNEYILLAENCSEHFDTWWNPEKFNWEDDSWILTVHFGNRIEDWWDEDKYNWKNCSWPLAECCSQYIKYWWNKDEFNWKTCSWVLAEHCSKQFNTWWNPEKFNWSKRNIAFLEKYCAKDKNIWEKRAVIEKIRRGV